MVRASDDEGGPRFTSNDLVRLRATTSHIEGGPLSDAETGHVLDYTRSVDTPVIDLDLRPEDVDFDAELIQVARAKGDRPYSLPMVNTVRKILQRRKTDNATSSLLSPFGGDHGFVFPSLSRDMKRVIPVAEVKERHQLTHANGQVVRDEDSEPVRVNTLPGIHVSRRTFNSVAAEIGIDLETREALMNHSGCGVNVKHYVQTERLDHLRASAERIERALWNGSRGRGARIVEGISMAPRSAVLINPRRVNRQLLS